MMPAFGQALSLEQLELVVDYIGEFCRSDAWPRGEFNLPRPLVTGKAFLEDEAVMTTSANLEDPGEIVNQLVLEYRLGARYELEVSLPFAWREMPEPGLDGADWHGSIEDMGLELKHTVYDNLGSGVIVSMAGELVLPTGDEQSESSGETAIFEPAMLYGRILPNDYFFQGQAGFELPFDTDDAEREAFWRGALGRSFQAPAWGRTWTPMLEVLGARPLESGAATEWDLVPQLQVSLSTRQHILFNLGLRIPVNDKGERGTQFMMYFLWDWFDGGLMEGW